MKHLREIAKFDPSKHPRIPKGAVATGNLHGGEFSKKNTMVLSHVKTGFAPECDEVDKLHNLITLLPLDKAPREATRRMDPVPPKPDENLKYVAGGLAEGLQAINEASKVYPRLDDVKRHRPMKIVFCDYAKTMGPGCSMTTATNLESFNHDSTFFINTGGVNEVVEGIKKGTGGNYASKIAMQVYNQTHDMGKAVSAYYKSSMIHEFAHFIDDGLSGQASLQLLRYIKHKLGIHGRLGVDEDATNEIIGFYKQVSPYSQYSPQEGFAEAFNQWMVNKKESNPVFNKYFDWCMKEEDTLLEDEKRGNYKFHDFPDPRAFGPRGELLIDVEAWLKAWKEVR